MHEKEDDMRSKAHPKCHLFIPPARARIRRRNNHSAILVWHTTLLLLVLLQSNDYYPSRLPPHMHVTIIGREDCVSNLLFLNFRRFPRRQKPVGSRWQPTIKQKDFGRAADNRLRSM